MSPSGYPSQTFEAACCGRWLAEAMVTMDRATRIRKKLWIGVLQRRFPEAPATARGLLKLGLTPANKSRISERLLAHATAGMGTYLNSFAYKSARTCAHVCKQRDDEFAALFKYQDRCRNAGGDPPVNRRQRHGPENGLRWRPVCESISQYDQARE